MAELTNSTSEPVVDNTETKAPEEATNKEPNTQPTEVTYTKAEAEALVSKAITNAKKAWESKTAKSTEELSSELAELKAQLAMKENQTYVSTEITKRGIPSDLIGLFYSEDELSSKEKLDTFSKWYKTAINDAVQEALNATQAPSFNSSTPNVSKASKGHDNFLEFYASKN